MDPRLHEANAPVYIGASYTVERLLARTFVLTAILFGYATTQGLLVPIITASATISELALILIVFFYRFRSLPEVSKKFELLSNLRNLQKEIKQVENTSEQLSDNKNKLVKEEKQKSDIEGIGSAMKQRLLASGIRTAADIFNVHIIQTRRGHHPNKIAYIEVPGRGRVHVQGINPKKANAFLSWKRNIESRFRSHMPQFLPANQEIAIKSKYQAQRQSLDLQEASAMQNAKQKKNTIQAKYQQEQNTLIKQSQDMQNQLTKRKDAVRTKYQQERDTLTKQLQDIPNYFANQRKDLKDKIRKERKRIIEKRWLLDGVQREIAAYRQVDFTTYLKPVLFPQQNKHFIIQTKKPMYWHRWAGIMVLTFIILGVIIISFNKNSNVEQDAQRPVESSFDSNVEDLKKKATDWGNLLVSLAEDKQSDIKILDIKSFLEPSLQASNRAEAYYDQYMNKSTEKLISFSIETVTIINENEKIGTVTYRSVHQSPDRSTKVLFQVTKWKKVDGAWYRTIQEPVQESGT
jgi:hypothetical protein